MGDLLAVEREESALIRPRRSGVAAINKCMAWKSKSARGEMLGSSTAIHRRDTRMILHNPDLYFFLCLLAGLAALLAIIYELSRPGRWNRAKPLDVVNQPQVKPLPRAVPVDRGQQDFAGHQSPSGRATDRIARDGQSVPAAAIPRDRSLPTEEKHVREKIDESPRPAGGQFSRLCENVKDLSPKEQARRMNEHFGVFGGAPPPKGRGPGRGRR